MAYDHMDLTEGEELYADEFGERIQSADDSAADDGEELIADEASEDEMAPTGFVDQADTFGETLKTDDGAGGTDGVADASLNTDPDHANDPERDTWAG